MKNATSATQSVTCDYCHVTCTWLWHNIFTGSSIKVLIVSRPELNNCIAIDLGTGEKGKTQLKKHTVGKIIWEINLRCLRFISITHIKNSPMQQIQFSHVKKQQEALPCTAPKQQKCPSWMKNRRFCTDLLLWITDVRAGFGTLRIYLLIWSRRLLTSVTLRKLYGERNVFLLPLNAVFKIAKAAVGKPVFSYWFKHFVLVFMAAC